MFDSPEQRLQALCGRRGLLLETRVPVGAYLAPFLIHAFDTEGKRDDVRILVELRVWSPSVAARMAEFEERSLEQLKRLSQVDFVAIVIPGEGTAPRPLTSLAELDEFLSGFGPPRSLGAAPVAGTRQLPSATHAYARALSEARPAFTGSRIVFCAMPFSPAMYAVFEKLIAPAVEGAGLIIDRTDQQPTLEAIDRRIRDGVFGSDLVVADLTGHNPNVMYEVGMAHAANKQTLLLRGDALELPFDVKYHEEMDYQLSDPAATRGRLQERLRRAHEDLWSAV